MGIEDKILSFLSRWQMQPKNVEQVMLPMTISGWIVGMGIIEFPFGNPWPITSFVYSLVLISGYGYLVQKTMRNMDGLITRKSESGIFIFKALFYGNVCLTIFGSVLGWIRMKSVKNIVKRFEDSDASMEKMGLTRDYRIIYTRQLISLISQFLLIFLFMLGAINWETANDASLERNIVASVALYYPVIVTSVGDLSFVTLVRFANMRFNQLNKCLLSMSTTTVNSPQHKRVLEYTRHKIFVKRTNDDNNAMKLAREYHHELIKISYTINDTFGVQALLSMTVSFALITGLLYNTCGIILWSSASQQLIDEELINATCWLAFYIYRIILINSACANTSAAAKKTGNIICHLHEPSTKKAYRDEIRDFTLQLTQHSLTFTACGFFTLNYEFIHGMIGSITTYLVILIQIGDIPPSQVLANMTKMAI